MKRIVLSLMLAASLAACGEKAEAPKTAEKPVVKIGIIGPMSGNNAALGINCRQGIEFAIAELPNKDVDYQLIVEDDAFQAAKVANAAQKLINVDKVDAIVTCSAVSGSVAAPIAAAAQKFMFTTIASEAKIAQQSKYSFLHWTSPLTEGKETLRLLNENGAKKIVLFVEVHPGAQALAKGVSDVAQEAGIEVEEISFLSSERNFTDIVLKAQEKQADMWVILSLQPGINLIGKKMQEQGIKIPYTTEEIPTFMDDKSMFEGVKFVDVYDGNPQMLARYKAKFATENTYAVAFAYDTMVILDKIISDFYAKNKRIPNSDELAESLSTMPEHNGVVGKVTIDSDGILQSSAAVKTVHDGQIITLDN